MCFLQPNLVLRGIRRKATYTVLRLIRNDCPNVWLGQWYEARLGQSKCLDVLANVR
jgi:hypothetical protein